MGGLTLRQLWMCGDWLDQIKAEQEAAQRARRSRR